MFSRNNNYCIMNKWDELSMAERANYIRLGVQNGIVSLDGIKEVYNKYVDGGPIYNSEEKRWYNSNGERLAVGHGYWSEKAKRYVMYGTDGSVTKYTPSDWRRKIGNDNIRRGGSRKVNISELTPDRNRNRAVNVSHLEEFQDSLIKRGYPEPQRIAILATAAQETDERGASTIGVGGNGLLGLSSKRMSTELLKDGNRGKQIKFLLDDLETTHSDNWLDGGKGGPKIVSGYDGYKKFWDSSNPEEATLILNKSYIRPRDREPAWNNRAKVASTLSKLIY